MMCLCCLEGGSYEDLERFCKCKGFLHGLFRIHKGEPHHIVDSEPCRVIGCGCSWQKGMWEKDYKKYIRKLYSDRPPVEQPKFLDVRVVRLKDTANRKWK